MSLLYIYRKWISTDEELIDEKIYESVGNYNVNIEEQEEEECTQDEIDNYIKNGYVWL